MPNFPVIDTHVHFWDPARLRYSWLSGSLSRAFLPEDFRTACGAVSVSDIVFVEAGAAAADAEREVEWVAGLVANEPRIRGIVANASLEEGAGAEMHLTRIAANPRVKGVRRLFQSEPDLEFCLRPAFVEGVKLLPRWNLSFDLGVRHIQLPAVIRLVRQCPEVRFVLDHIGKPDIRSGVQDPWREQIRELAILPNVVCKVSGAVTEADREHWKPSDLRPYIEHVIAAFGWDRVLYGSDWPVATLASDYPRWVETLDSITAACSESERRALFVENARRVYRITS